MANIDIAGIGPISDDDLIVARDEATICLMHPIETLSSPHDAETSKRTLGLINRLEIVEPNAILWNYNMEAADNGTGVLLSVVEPGGQQRTVFTAFRYQGAWVTSIPWVGTPYAWAPVPKPAPFPAPMQAGGKDASPQA